jgi:hypothetical protein
MRTRKALLFTVLACLALSECSRKAHGPALIYRSRTGGIDLVLSPSPIMISAAGEFEGEPAADRSKAGDVLVAVRDHNNSVWVNSWRQADWHWGAWIRTSAITAGNPSVVYETETSGLVAIRDSTGSYWISKVNITGGAVPTVATSVSLKGAFQSDPVLVRYGPRKFLIAGIDQYSSSWSALVDDEGQLLRPWKQAGALLRGGLCGVEGTGAAILVGRDTSNQVGILRIPPEGDGQWKSIGINSADDPSCSKLGEQVLIGAIGDGGRGYINQCDASSSQCGEWRFMAEGLQNAAVAAGGREIYFFARLGDNSVSRWSSDGGWRGIGEGSLARGRLVALSSQ